MPARRLVGGLLSLAVVAASLGGIGRADRGARQPGARRDDAGREADDGGRHRRLDRAVAERFVGHTPAIERLCIPELNLHDGGGGVGGFFRGVTQPPAPIVAGATWDPALNHEYLSMTAEELYDKGGNVLLAPALDVIRDPCWGRSMETVGEDPYLNARLGVAQIHGAQQQGVLAQAKHVAVYVQEILRDSEVDDHVVDERTLHEIYLPMFEAAVNEADVASVMCAYNLLNGQPTCGNEYLLNQVFKQLWGFDGFVTADWFAQRSSIDAANYGLDQEMPKACFFGSALKRNIELGFVPQQRLDDMVKRILRKLFEFGWIDNPPVPNVKANVRTREHALTARGWPSAAWCCCATKVMCCR